MSVTKKEMIEWLGGERIRKKDEIFYPDHAGQETDDYRKKELKIINALIKELAK